MADTTVTSTSPSSPTIHGFFETQTSTWQYLVVDPTTSIAAIIDPVLDFDRETQTVSTTTADALLAFIASNNYTISHILETHIHADHLTAASYLQTRLTQTQTESSRPPICAGKRIEQVQTLFATRYSIPTVEHQTAFDKLFDDDETFRIGNLEAVAIHLPGHTPDHLGYHIGDNIFCGDSVFHPDIGTARCDFPGGSAESLYHSGKRLLAMDPETKIWVGHDYPPAERGEEVPYMTVREHREHNKHLREGVEKDEFVRLRRERDQKLGEPRLLHPSLQINVRGGRMPAPASATLREGVEGEQPSTSTSTSPNSWNHYPIQPNPLPI
ncbi:MBL fold metallo-hydrolase [Aspergillus homomorphus CBS 101889]|uniref:Putative metallo-beta-lactamase domain protein n=1 Tax=Aspergillus homomorphus (strain CBS 101889) TaxID=1450537 RepID=A0A395IBQ3_ASPHC|nr:putative metallo-beta-lactamase domain protein [Aspergillus homomorphus CBS 101889]RAL17476.1 putative metallo-beta-lactamase domain protein [Aspergillus homomorphus CBS 101889]